MFNINFLFYFLFIHLAIATEAIPQTVYGHNAFFAGLSPKGSADGSNWDNQWDYTSVQWDSIGANDTLYLDGGLDSVVYISTLSVKSNGAYDNYAVISTGRDVEHRGKVIFETDTSFGTNMDGATFTELNGFVYRNITNGKIIRVQYTHHIRIKNCLFENIEDYAGIYNLNSDNFEVIGCYLESVKNIEEQTDCIAIGGADSIRIIGNTIIQQNEAYDPHTDGIQFWDCEDAWIEGNKVFLVNNKSTHCQIIYSTSHSGKFWMINNQVYISSPSSSPVVAVQNASSSIDSIYFCNNTILSNSPAHQVPIVDTDTTGNYGHLVSKNNILINTNSSTGIGAFDGLIDYDIDYNLYYGPLTSDVMIIDGTGKTLSEMQALGYDIYSYDTKPEFSNFDWTFSENKSVFLNYDFSLLEGSVGINLGKVIEFYNKDIVGISRPQGAAWDIGAYEANMGPDLTSPEIIRAELWDSAELHILFSEPLESTSALNSDNYSITGGISVISASLSGSQVILNTSIHPAGAYTVTVANISDLSGNQILATNNSAEYKIIVPKLILSSPETRYQDDMCIWVHPADESQSTIITSDKNAYKLIVYDLNGNVIQSIDVSGQPGNIDVRYDFLLSGEEVDIIAYNDRSNELIVLYKVNPVARTLTQIGSFDAGAWTTEIYGFCLYHSFTGKYYAIASGKSSQMRQWELVDNGDGTIIGIEKRTWFNSIGYNTEGLVVDDETGILYAANEFVGVYKYNAEPIEQNPSGSLIIPSGYNGLEPKLKGISLYYAGNGEGYLFVSNQGGGNYKVYQRSGQHNFVKTILVDGASKTEGLDVLNIGLGPSFIQGMFLCSNGGEIVFGCDYSDLDLIIDLDYWHPRNSPLPVELKFFTGTLNGKTIELKWRTETEVSNYGFDIERKEKYSNWETIGFVEGNGNSNSPKSYSFIDKNPIGGSKFQYRLKQIDTDGKFEYSDIVEIELVPTEFALYQNYPNPFNSSTIIRYSLPIVSNVDLNIFSILGEIVHKEHKENQEAGYFEIEFNGYDLSSGTYFYQLKTDNFVQTKKMILMK